MYCILYLNTAFKAKKVQSTLSNAPWNPRCIFKGGSHIFKIWALLSFAGTVGSCLMILDFLN
jgi:hypothetical protein